MLTNKSLIIKTKDITKHTYGGNVFVYILLRKVRNKNLKKTDDRVSISRNVADINKLVQDKAELFFQNILQHA